jgi:hypothetical protein
MLQFHTHNGQLTLSLLRSTAKQVAQQIAQRAAFLVDQAIQEKVRHLTYQLIILDFGI